MSTLAINNTFSLINKQETITASLIDGYARQLDTAETTKKTYLYCVNKFVNWLSARGISECTYEILVIYKQELKRMYKARAINTHITAIKDFFKYLERKGFKNIAKDLKKERVSSEHAKDSLTADQIKSILNNIDTSTLEGARANAIFRLLIGTGVRECEIVRANIEDLRTLGNKTVLYVQGKGEQERNKYVVVYPSVMESLQHYFKLRGVKNDKEPLFVSNSDRNNGSRLSTRTVQRVIKGLYSSVGIVNSRLTTHSTRHTAITLAILNGADIQQVQAMARHKDINTTMIYYHNINRLENSAEEKLESIFKNL